MQSAFFDLICGASLTTPKSSNRTYACKPTLIEKETVPGPPICSSAPASPVRGHNLSFVHPEVRYEDATSLRLNHLNLGTGTDITIAELAAMIAEITGFEGEIIYDTSKPDGTPRKLLDVSRVSELGWKAQIPLREGIEVTYQWFLENRENLRQR